MTSGRPRVSSFGAPRLYFRPRNLVVATLGRGREILRVNRRLRLYRTHTRVDSSETFAWLTAVCVLAFAWILLPSTLDRHFRQLQVVNQLQHDHKRGVGVRHVRGAKG